jgi:purine catabolism regulator
MYSYLGISVEELLNLDALNGAKVLGGTKGLAKRITKVNVMEVPDIIEWVSEGEFLITAAYSIKDNIMILLDLIPKLKEKGVVGLGIKVGRYVSQLPEKIIELSNTTEFPIIELPFCISHTDIISIILTEVINNQMNMLIKMEKLNREVMEIMMKGGGIKEIAKKLHDNIGNSLAIYESMNDSAEIICDDNLDRNIIERIIFEHINPKHEKEDNDIEGIYNAAKDNFNGRYFERVSIPIVIEKVKYGFIFIWIDKKALNPIDNMLIESYVHLIAVEFVKELSLYNMESSYKLEFFDDLLTDNESRQKNALEKAKIFNFQKDLRYSAIIILLKDLYKDNRKITKKMNYIQESISSLLFIINRKIKHSKDKIIYVDKSDRILILFGSEFAKSAEEIKRETNSFCEDILNDALKTFRKNELIFGIGRSYNDASQLWKSHKQAKLIVENLSKTIIGSIVHFDDLGLYRILSFDGLKGELLDFCEDTIKPLMEYDKANNTELVKTLKNYFQCNGNMKKLSEKMYMHYNTIIYRLQKIKEITGLDIDDSNSRLNLEIALKIIDLIKI